MNQVGSLALIAALAFAGYGAIAGAVGGKLRSMRVLKSAERAALAFFVTITLAVSVLEYLILTNDFHSAYVAEHSNLALPLYYKIPVLWAGQEGSLLFWTWLLSLYGGLAVLLNRSKNRQLMPYVVAVTLGVGVFFAILVNFVANPFSELSLASASGAAGKLAAFRPPDGNGLNPSLQYPSMVIHPPMLYLGYVGMTVPFAFALGALIMRYPGEKWIHITRRWTMVTWMFLTCGIFLGAHWAYSVLGWGGYWGWDPVENASLLPWLTGTAFLHSVMMQEKRGMMKVWNVWLIFSTFLLSLLGTFLTRSGVVSSVHAFAQSSIGSWFLTFMGIVFTVCLFFFVKNRSHLKSEHRLESLISRESSFLFNNLLLLVSCFAVLWGTLFPILSEWVQGSKVTVGPPFFNRVNVPIAIFLLLLTAVGPLLAWRKTSLDSLKRNFGIPALLAVLAAVALVLGGMRPWQDVATFYSLMAMSLAVLVAATIFSEFFRGARVIRSHSGQNLFAAALQLTRRNTRRYGGYIVHFGVVVIAIGLAGAAFNQEKEQELGNGDSMQIGSYTLTCRSFTQDDNANFESEWAIIDVSQNGKPVATLYPERRLYKASQQPSTIVANHSTLKEDLYLVYSGRNNDTERPIIKAHINPLVAWIWAGVLVMVFGTLIGLTPSEAALRVTHAVPALAPSEPATAGATVAGGD